ncbi:hypothetical protein N577_006010 [Lacticaseibacillus rhamnosus 2166]|nr:hypothetical protein N577_006010 [Lacticaseibacillus rhamnosus 2166]
MASVNDLNTAWISAGQKVTDLQDKSQKMAVAWHLIRLLIQKMTLRK